MKKSLSYFFAAMLCISFFQCAEDKVGTSNPPNLRIISGEEQEMVQSSNTFAVDLFRKVNEFKDKENIFISPLSISFALHMAANGANDSTKAAIKKALHVDHLSDEEANTVIRNLTELLLSMDNKVDLAIANSIWYDQQFTLKEQFANIISNYYDGRIEGLDFANPAAKDVINNWVEDKTQGKIREMLSDISKDEAMFLINAIYFKADWTYQFEKSQTAKAPFTLEDGSQQTIDMMFSKGVTLNRYANETLQLLEIPYGNGQFNMLILLPNTDKTTQDVLSQLSMQNLDTWIAQADTLTPQLYLPKFTLKFKLNNMKDILSDMGMATVGFSGFFEEQLPLEISRVIHEGFIEVNEEGSEAAATTVVGIQLTSAGNNDPLTIRVDRPFLFFIWEKHSGAILFAGKMLNPVSNL